MRPTTIFRLARGRWAAALVGALLFGATSGAAATLLGSAQTFAVLGSSAVTNAGATTIKGDLGISPGATIAGLGSIALDGDLHEADAVAQSAAADARTAFDTLAALSSAVDLSGSNLGAVGVLTPGVYRFDAAAQLTGTLILDFTGDPDAAFVFQIGAALTTAAGSDVVVENGGPHSAVYWEVGSAATLGTDTAFAGNLLADQAITFGSGASILCGRAFSLDAAVTLDTNTVSDSCAHGGDFGTGRSDFGSSGFSLGGLPEPPSWLILLVGCSGLGGMLREGRRRQSPS